VWGVAGLAVSVVIPSFRRIDWLGRAIDSVLAQTVSEFEVVVVDDGPSDRVAQFVACHPDPRVRCVRHEVNRGVAAARNTGVAAARGPVIGFLDHDDVWLPTKLERQLAAMDQTGAEVVHSLVYIADDKGHVYERATEDGFRLFREVAAAGYPYHLLARRSSFFFGTFLVTRSCIELVGEFDTEVNSVDDVDYVHRLARIQPLHLVDEPLAMYCFHGANQVLARDPMVSIRLAAKELRWLAEAQPPNSTAIKAYNYKEIAIAWWIARRYRRAPWPALRARLLDRTVMPLSTLAKYCTAALLPRRLADLLRERVSAARTPAEPYPWVTL
jgi:glycosyltransferase involved in cell wall biosynthesis